MLVNKYTIFFYYQGGAIDTIVDGNSVEEISESLQKKICYNKKKNRLLEIVEPNGSKTLIAPEHIIAVRIKNES